MNKNIVLNIVQEYYNDLGKEYPCNFKIQITSDIENDYKKYARYDKTPTVNNNYNAIVIPPICNDDFIILLNNNKIQIRNLMDYLKAKQIIIHELTHMDDFIEYSEILNSNNYLEFLKIEKHGHFTLWSEFHAKSMDSKYLYYGIMGEETPENKNKLSNVINNSFQNRINMLYTDCTSTDAYYKCYYLMRFLGELVVYQEISPIFFNNRNLKEWFKESKWIYDLYILLINHKSLKDIYRYFDTMNEILSQNKL